MKKFNKQPIKWTGSSAAETKSGGVYKGIEKGEMLLKKDHKDVKDQKDIKTSTQSIKTAKSAFDLPFPSITLIVGMTGSGKTQLLRELIRMQAIQKKFHRVIVMCPTAYMQDKTPYDFMDQKNVLTKSSLFEDQIKGILKQQELRKKAGQPVNTHLILDDVITKVKFKNSDLWDEIASCGRHYNLSVTLLLQNISGKIPPILKEAASQAFITKIKNRDMKAVFELQGHFRSIKDFDEYLEHHTKDYGVVRIELTGKREPDLLPFRFKPSGVFNLGPPR
jgi:hypothetical protein